MSHRGPLAAVVSTVLGVALGGLLVWRVYRTKRKRPPSFQKALRYPSEALPPPVEEDAHRDSRAVACQSTEPPTAGRLQWLEKLLATEPRTVSTEDEWLQQWPRLQEELALFPVLGLDCEWVKNNTARELQKPEKSVNPDFSSSVSTAGKIHHYSFSVF